MKMKKYSFILLMMAAMLLPSCGNARTHKPLMGGVLPAETRSAATNDESAATAVSAGDFWLPAKLTGVPEQILQRHGISLHHIPRVVTSVMASNSMKMRMYLRQELHTLIT